jgi:pimeloyl-ACP methyl ester carboxylesterase
MTQVTTRGVGTFVLFTLAILVSCSNPASSSARSTGRAGLKAVPCRVGQSQAKALCGTFTVFENLSSHTGRTIGVRFILIKAKHPSHRAIAFNPGGPGASSTALAADFADATTGAFGSLRDRYDILLVDNRGTGGSAPQQCDFAPPRRPELYFRQLWPDILVRSCRNRLASHANLSLYSTSLVADDLDDLRAVLGYPRLVLYGGSYGTFFYLVYARRHPEHVESIVLEGVAPPHFYILPLPMARGAQTAINGLEAACRSDATCSSRFPEFAKHFAAIVHRFDAGPVTIAVQNTITHQAQRVQLSKEVFAETVRHAMYVPADAAYIPVTIERAYHGGYTPLAEMVDQRSRFFANIQSNGLNLSVTCAEDIPFITEQAVARDNAGTFEGDARVRAQQRACRLWNVAPVPAAFIAPVRSNAPILMISGSDDPATPPSYARAALQYLPHARMMLVPGASHDSDYPPCVDATIVAFVRAGSASGLKFSRCAAVYHRPPFAALAYDEVPAGENATQTKRLRKIIDSMLQGRIDRSQLTPAVSKQYSDAVLKGFAADASGLGPLQNSVFKEMHRSSRGSVYKYLLRFAQGNATATFTLDSSNRIQGLDISAA